MPKNHLQLSSRFVICEIELAIVVGKFAEKQIDVIEIPTKRQKLGRFPIDNTGDVTIVVRQDVCRSKVTVNKYNWKIRQLICNVSFNLKAIT
jgi:predicted metalloenzyme YecM